MRHCLIESPLHILGIIHKFDNGDRSLIGWSQAGIPNASISSRSFLVPFRKRCNQFGAYCWLGDAIEHLDICILLLSFCQCYQLHESTTCNFTRIKSTFSENLRNSLALARVVCTLSCSNRYVAKLLSSLIRLKGLRESFPRTFPCLI